MTVASISVRVLVILLAVAGATGHVAYLDALWWHALNLTRTAARDVSGATLVLLSAHAVVSVLCSVLSIRLVLHERRRPEAARALGIAFASWSYLMAYSGVTMLFRPVAPGFEREVFEAHFLAIEVLGLAALLRFTAIFPRQLGPEELLPSETLPPALVPLHRAGALMRRPAAPWIGGLLILGLAWSVALASRGSLSDAGLSRAMDLVRLCVATLVVMNLRRAWTAATEGDRDNLAWLGTALAVLLGSLAVLVGGNVLVAVTGFPEPHVAWRPILLDFGLAGFLWAVAMSVLQDGSLDPARVTGNVAKVCILATAGLFLAAGLEALFTGSALTVPLRRGVGTAIAFAVVLSTHRGLSRMAERLVPSW